MLIVIWLVPPMMAEYDSQPIVGNPKDMDAVSAARQALLWIAGGLIAVATLVFTYRRDAIAQNSADLDRDANYTTRYTEAIKQLGDLSVPIKLGGVYALERVAHDSSRDRETTCAVLAAFLRHESSVQALRSGTDSRLPVHLEAAAAVLGRITQNHGLASAMVIDLRATYLPGANLEAANLEKAMLSQSVLESALLSAANLAGAQFDGATLDGADLTGAVLHRSDLSFAVMRRIILADTVGHSATLSNADLTDSILIGADFSGSNFAGATFVRADLTRASFVGASFHDANLSGADLQGADFSNADLSGCVFDDAILSDETKWPSGFDVDASKSELPDNSAYEAEWDDDFHDKLA
ncbi:pentapeptide repeat-containing protein [Microbacterium sp. W4I20]|uniref:pentapeptide repeat-containing protein n=1 Tax=Microbacterium sp. W4I20 TaxID=3042262 RepID=UPI00277F801A|nr:pentapeptide repeat-containing protein [Microbacterium sp. W4I20]MDQ0727252.1 uncharacterized protein YjbI with pentapeptide repeats [Microbacterium sp. W4I20]